MRVGTPFVAAWLMPLMAAGGVPPRLTAPATVGLVQRDSPSAAKDVPTFQKDIAPLLKARCTPCHFKGGTVVERYPFAQHATVQKLGIRLNTRLKGADADLVSRWVKAKSPE